MTGTGGEKLPDGLDPKSVMVERSVPLKAMEDALLAWEMNGEPLPHAHGGPLRLVVPGYSGVNNIKYIKRLAFTAQETDAAIQKTGYRMSPPGAEGRPQPARRVGDGRQVLDQRPGARGGPAEGRQGADPRRGHGRHAALCAGGRVASTVARPGSEARLVGPDLGRFAWRQFVLPVQAGAGQLRAGFARAGRRSSTGRPRPRRKMRAATSTAVGAPMRCPMTVA